MPAVDATPEPPFTLSIDIGGTGLKASVLGKDGTAPACRPRPGGHELPHVPEQMVAALTTLAPAAARLRSRLVRLPGHGAQGHVLSAPHFVTKKGPGTPVDPKLFEAWSDFDMVPPWPLLWGKPTKVANDADVQGAAVVQGKGLEVVITLGTGFGTAVFMDGQLLPHLEIAHQPFRKNESYNEQLGELARKKIGDHHWNRRVRKALDCLEALFFFDHLFIGGGKRGPGGA